MSFVIVNQFLSTPKSETIEPMKDSLVVFILRLLSLQSIPSIVPWAFRSIRSLYRNTPRNYLNLLERSADREDWIYQFFAAHEIGSLHTSFPEESLELLKRLSSSSTEIVREGCAKSWTILLNDDFDATFPLIRDLRDDGSYEERYTAAIAPVEYYKECPDTDRRRRIIEFWKSYEDDPKQGLWNLVRTQILEKYVEENG